MGKTLGDIFHFSAKDKKIILMSGMAAAFAALFGTPMAAVFCGLTNCPITSLLISFELFGFTNSYYFLIAVATSYMLSGYYSLYHTQTIVYSKFDNRYINRPAGHR